LVETVKVYVGFNDIFLQEFEENLFLTVLLIEDAVTGYPQAGYSGPYTHNRVARHILTPLGLTDGDPVYGDPVAPEDVQEGSYVERSYSASNVQFCLLGDVKDFD